MQVGPKLTNFLSAIIWRYNFVNQTDFLFLNQMEYNTGILDLDSQFLARCVVVGSLAKASVLLKFASSRCKKKRKKKES